MPNVPSSTAGHSKLNQLPPGPPAQPLPPTSNQPAQQLEPAVKQIVTPQAGNTANGVNRIPSDQQAEVEELLEKFVAALDNLSSKNASQLSGHGHAPAIEPNTPNIPTQPPAPPKDPVRQIVPSQANTRSSPGKKNTMSEAISNCFSGRYGTVAGAIVFGLVAVSAIALMSTFPPILMFGALFGIAVASEMAKPVREFQTTVRARHAAEKLDQEQEDDDEQNDTAAEPLQPPLPPMAPPQSPTPAALLPNKPANSSHPVGAHLPVTQRQAS
ncbi:MAG: hypothetical protein ACI802_000132 [Candidatus Paceibacteria bacterium]|jgi:hypothetical protein